MTPQSIEWIFAISFIIVGVSHLVQAQRWSEAFARLFETRHAGFIIALYSLPIGLFLALGSRGFVWDVGLIVTLYGWALVVKSAVYLWHPGITQIVVKKGGLSEAKSRGAGAGLMVLGAIVGAAGLWPGVFGR